MATPEELSFARSVGRSRAIRGRRRDIADDVASETMVRVAAYADRPVGFVFCWRVATSVFAGMVRRECVHRRALQRMRVLDQGIFTPARDRGHEHRAMVAAVARLDDDKAEAVIAGMEWGGLLALANRLGVAASTVTRRRMVGLAEVRAAGG